MSAQLPGLDGLQNSTRPPPAVSSMALTAFCLVLPEMNLSRSLCPEAGRRPRISMPSMMPVCPVVPRWSHDGGHSTSCVAPVRQMGQGGQEPVDEHQLVLRTGTNRTPSRSGRECRLMP